MGGPGKVVFAYLKNVLFNRLLVYHNKLDRRRVHTQSPVEAQCSLQVEFGAWDRLG